MGIVRGDLANHQGADGRNYGIFTLVSCGIAVAGAKVDRAKSQFARRAGPDFVEARLLRNVCVVRTFETVGAFF